MAGLFTDHVADLGGTQIEGIASQSINRGIAVSGEPLDGEVRAGELHISRMDVRAELATTEIATALAAVGADGAALSDVILYFAKKTTGVGKTSGGAHVSHTFATALVVPRRLTVSGQGVAQLTYSIIPYKADGTIPVAVATTASLPAITAISGEKFRLGPVIIEGTTLTGITSVSVDFGLTVDPEVSDGDIYAKTAVITRQMPKIEIRTLDQASIATLTAGGKAVTNGVSGTKIYLRKTAADGIFSSGSDHVLVEP